MSGISESFSRIYLPYCVERVEGHGHVVLNRLYKPLGIRSRDWLDYTPHAVELKGLTAAKAAAISHDASADMSRIYLYADGSKPTLSNDSWQAYQKRLELLAGLKVA